MKSIRRILLVAGIIAALSLGRAQTSAQSAWTAWETDWRSVLEAAESTTPLPASQAPRFGTFFSAQFGNNCAPLPGDTLDLPFWSLGDGLYIMDDRDVDYAELQAETEASLSEGLASGFSIMASSLLNSSYAYRNPVYLTNMAAASGGSATAASFTIAGGTNFVPYDILMSTNLANPVGSWN